MDGQQRITSIGRFLTGKFAILDEHGMQQYFSGLAENLQRKILDTKLTIYECSGTESEIKEWFKTIIAIQKKYKAVDKGGKIEA